MCCCLYANRECEPAQRALLFIPGGHCCGFWVRWETFQGELGRLSDQWGRHGFYTPWNLLCDLPGGASATVHQDTSGLWWGRKLLKSDGKLPAFYPASSGSCRYALVQCDCSQHQQSGPFGMAWRKQLTWSWSSQLLHCQCPRCADRCW